MKFTMPATIEDLPDPIIEYIFSYLSPYRDLKQCMQVNRAWYRYVCDVVRKTQRDFYKAVCSMSVSWCHIIAEPGLTISKRYSHSACCNGNSMYIFGGCTTANTTFNDLWRLDLGTRCWIRPLATGTYPPPKACATLVSHGENLILFGGWTHTAPYPLHQEWRVFNQIHLYNTITNRWTLVISMPCCPPMAGHSATVHGDFMVVFGGIQRQVYDGPFQRQNLFNFTSPRLQSCSNEVWILDLKTYKWQKQATSPVQPPPRYGHSQIFIDKHHLLIMGGCGGPNMLYTDIWLLKMTGNPNEVWEWQEMDVHMKENAAPHLAFHPACKVGSQVVVLSKAQKSRTSPSSLPQLLRAPTRLWIPPRPTDDPLSRLTSPMSVDVEHCINGKRGVFKRQMDRQHNKSCQMSSSDEDDCQLQDVAKKKSNSPIYNSSAQMPQDVPSTSGVQESTVNYQAASAAAAAAHSSVSQTFDGVGTSNSENSASKNDSKSNFRPNNMIRKNRQRQLEGLDRMEQRIKDLRARNVSLPASFSKIFQKSPSVLTTKNPMCLYVLDISQAVSNGHVSWRMIKKQSPAAPEEIILYSLVLGKGELIMFGGIQKDLNSRQQVGESVPEVVSNSLHFMTAERFVI